jgi:hypothetical protein
VFEVLRDQTQYHDQRLSIHGIHLTARQGTRHSDALYCHSLAQMQVRMHRSLDIARKTGEINQPGALMIMESSGGGTEVRLPSANCQMDRDGYSLTTIITY